MRISILERQLTTLSTYPCDATTTRFSLHTSNNQRTKGARAESVGGRFVSIPDSYERPLLLTLCCASPNENGYAAPATMYISWSGFAAECCCGACVAAASCR